jgi:negative regulator of flagellin synthesis FlgM
MSIKIGQPPEIQSPITPAQTSAVPRGAQPVSPSESANVQASQGARSAGVAVSVSNFARDVSSSEGTGSSAEVDMQKVAAMRSAIQNGTFVPNPEAIADKLISNAQDMLNQSRG